MPTSRGAAALTQVVRELDEAGIRIDDIGLRRPTLDDVFLSLTGHARPGAKEDAGVTRRRRRPHDRASTRRLRPAGFGRMAVDSAVITWRNLKRIPRIPELAAFAILQSIMFVLLFAFVFGGAILLPGYPDPNAYRGVPDARHLRPDDRVRLGDHRDRDGRGPPRASSTGSGRCRWPAPRC